MTACTEICADVGETGPITPAGPTDVVHRPAPATVLLDQRGQGQRSFCSWHDLGWRSLLLREFTSNRHVDATVPPLEDQLVVLVLSGSKTIESRHGRHWRRARYDPGRIAFTAPHRPSTVRWRTNSAEPQRALHVHLPGATMSAAAEGVWDSDAAHVTLPDALSTNDPLIEQLLRSLRAAAHKGAGDLYAESVAALLSVHLITEHAGLGAPPQRTREDARIQQAECYIHDNLHAPITLAAIAAEVHLSPYHFLRLFQQSTGESPHRYLERIRVEAAHQMLTQSRTPVPAIAARCGFSSPAHLRAATLRQTGLTPGALRRG